MLGFLWKQLQCPNKTESQEPEYCYIWHLEFKICVIYIPAVHIYAINPEYYYRLSPRFPQKYTISAINY